MLSLWIITCCILDSLGFVGCTVLIKLVDNLLFGLDNNHVCGMVLVDYRKAFDMVDHMLLLRKLEQYGIVNRELA